MGFETSDSAVALVGMVGFALLAAIDIDGELHQLVETTATVVGCGGRGTRALSKGRRHVRVRDLPTGGRPVVVVVWRKRIWRCPEADCEVGSWTEQTTAVAPRASMTERARGEACRQVGEQNRSVAGVARDLGVGWSTVMAAVYDHGRPLVDDPARASRVSALGLDEVASLRANARRHTTFATNFVDLDRGRLIDVVPGRSGKAVHDWLGTRASSWLAGIDTVGHRPLPGLRQRHRLPLGPRHLGGRPVPRHRPGQPSRRRRTPPGPAGPAGPPRSVRPPPLRHPPAAAAGHRAPHRRQRARLEAGLAGDPVDEVLDTVLAKEALRWSYAVPDLAEATRRFDTFIAECRIPRVPELHRLARTALHWRTEILAHHRHRGLQRAHRGGESRRQVGSASAPWLPQLRELSAPGPSSLRGGMAHSSCRTNQAALSPLSRVEPNNEQVNLSQPQFA